MATYRMMPFKERRDGQITMRRATFDAMLAQQDMLKEIEAAARSYVMASRWVATSDIASEDELRTLSALRKALYEYDGWGPDWEQADEVVESLQSIADELEGRG